MKSAGDFGRRRERFTDMSQAAVLDEPSRKRVAFVCQAGSALDSLRPLFSTLIAQGHRVFVLAPALTKSDAAALAILGVDAVGLGAEDSGWRLLSDWKAIGAIRQQLMRWGVDTVVAAGAQTMIYGALAARRAHVARVVVIVGSLPEHRFAGHLAEDEMPAWRYGQALRSADRALFHNDDDIGLLNRLGIIPEGLPVSLAPAAGVDLEAFPLKPLPSITQGLVFLMVANRDPLCGAADYCAAAALLRQRAPGCRFLLAALPNGGDADGHAADAQSWAVSQDVELLDASEFDGDLLAQAHVFVCPARSGSMPQPILHAMAIGRPIIASAIAGCRQAVDERGNGYLVPPRDVEALAEAMGSFLRRPDLIPSMARASRAKAEKFASAADIERTLLEALALDDM